MSDNYIKSQNQDFNSDRNRAYDVRRDNDTFKTPSITLYDIDYAILNFLKEGMQFQLEENGKMINVPVMYAGGETWSQIQRHGYLRDKTRKILTPIIILRRNGISEDDRFPQLDVRGNDKMNSVIIRPKRSPMSPSEISQIQTSDRYDFFQETENSNKGMSFYVSVIPTFVKVTYDLFVWTELVSQMNVIIEKLMQQNRLIWGDSFKFTTSFTDVSLENINDTGTDRLVRASIQLDVSGKLQEAYELFESNIKKAHSIKRFVFENEVEQTEIYTEMRPKIIRIPKSRLPETNFE